jgi:hypothetical protein
MEKKTRERGCSIQLHSSMIRTGWEVDLKDKILGKQKVMNKDLERKTM